MKKTKNLNYYLSLAYQLQLTKIQVEDGDGYLAEIPLLKGCMSDGETPDEAVKNLEEAKKEWLTYMLENGLEIPEPALEDDFSGKFTVRIPKSLHKVIAEQSKKEGLSLNQYVSNSLAYIAGQKRNLLAK
ncbi:type II toxin-antitoxin system HicB family antitoxin [uncultured Phascolarctobacterium sp.]|uniref:type II toxin-antitoxin system HicB family antitoxin n=1 Tax=Phascolarctobacterium sp. TaxID=2049039 RepID=UPI0025E1D5BB|nr:type II toxin-antitoxin system HicB family antitoxin [uncultured Phascolarctobacterium sp.]